MKINCKKHVFTIVMCIMLVISSMSSWAATAEIGDGHEKATCSVTIVGRQGRAYTTPHYYGNEEVCYTEVILYSGGIQRGIGYGSTYAMKEMTYDLEISRATSYHQILNYYTSLSVYA